MEKLTSDQAKFLREMEGKNRDGLRYDFPTDRTTTRSQRRKERFKLGFVVFSIACILLLIYISCSDG